VAAALICQLSPGFLPWQYQWKTEQLATLSRFLFATGDVGEVAEFEPRMVMKLNIVFVAVRFAGIRAGAFRRINFVGQMNPFAHQRLTSGFLP
jgi:hypothetical protein